MAKLSITHLGILLICSVTVACEKSCSETDQEWELEEPTGGFLDTLMDRYGNHTLSLKELPYKCCMCKESVRAVRLLVMNELQQKIDDICNVIRSVRKKCISKAKTYQEKILRVMFPGGPKVICKMLKMCN